MKHAGSPPHTREPPHSDRIPQLQAGITPAYAGTTYCNNLICCIRQDHPRIRGNHQKQYSTSTGGGGSPPHTREPLHALYRYVFQLGITPAYAGTTLSYLRTQTRIRDHPRIRGNHISIAFWSRSVSGSPPHTREPLHALYRYVFQLGITPAYAGTTTLYAMRSGCTKDHPRIRGNHGMKIFRKEFAGGSPPHTREPQ